MAISRAQRGVKFKSWGTAVNGTTFTVTVEDLVLAKTSGGTIAITLPASVPIDSTSAGKQNERRMVQVVDLSGAAQTSNITVSPAGSDKINGASSFVLGVNYMMVAFVDIGGGWLAMPLGAGGNLTIPGSLTVSGNPLVLGSNATIAAAGSTQGTAAALTAVNNQVTGADGTKGVVLPSTPVVNQEVVVINTNLVSALKVYADSGGTGGTINGGAANAAVSLAAGKAATFICISITGANQWWSLSN